MSTAGVSDVPRVPDFTEHTILRRDEIALSDRGITRLGPWPIPLNPLTYDLGIDDSNFLWVCVALFLAVYGTFTATEMEADER